MPESESSPLLKPSTFGTPFPRVDTSSSYQNQIARQPRVNIGSNDLHEADLDTEYVSPLVTTSIAERAGLYHVARSSTTSNNGTVGHKTQHNNVLEDDNHCDKKDNSCLKLSSMTARQRKILVVATICQCIMGCGMSVMAPVYPYEATRKGMSPMLIGIVFGIFDVIALIAYPLFGNYLAKIGPRFVILAGVFMVGCSLILMGLLSYCPDLLSFAVLSILCRSIWAIGDAAMITSSFAIVCNEYSERIGIIYGIIETSDGLGHMIGPALSGALFGIGGFGLPFYVNGAMQLASGMLMYIIMPDVNDADLKRQNSIFSLLRSPLVVLSFCSIAICVTGINGLDATYAKLVEPFHWSAGVVGLIYAILPIMFAIFTPLMGHLCDSKGLQLPMIILGHLLFGVAFLVLGPSIILPAFEPKTWIIIVVFASIGLAYGFVLVGSMASIVKGALELKYKNNLDTFAMSSGLFYTAHSVGGIVGPIAESGLVQEYGYRIAFTPLAIISLLVIAFHVLNFVCRSRRKQREDSTCSTDDEIDLHMSFSGRF